MLPTPKIKGKLSQGEMINIIRKYGSYNAFCEQTTAYVNKYGLDDTIGDAKTCRKEILAYKLAMAKKHAKSIKQESFFVDLSDADTKDITDNILNLRKAQWKIRETSDELSVNSTYLGNVCLPFRSCYVFAQVKDLINAVIDINALPNGEYHGCIYSRVAKARYIQVEFKITHNFEGNFTKEWNIIYTLRKHCRPLGGIVSNLNSLLAAFLNFDEKAAKETLQGGKHVIVEVLGAILDMLPICLSYLTSYKSKLLYEVKDDTSYFVYANDNSNIEQYIEEHYPKSTYEKVEGWLSTGYWKFLEKGQSGKSFDGKTISRLDWIEPYANDYKAEQKKSVSSNGQQNILIPMHPLERLKDRYGVDMTSEDLNNIVKQILAGRDVKKLSIKNHVGMIKMAKGITGCYRVQYQGNCYDLVLSRCSDVDSYRVATFLPKPTDIHSLVVDSSVYNKIQQDIK